MKYNQKIILLSLLILVIIIGVFLDIKQKTNEKIAKELSNKEEKQIENIGKETEKYCFYKNTQNQNGFFDTAWISFEINENKINGEFRNLPGGTDGMIGDFEGYISPSLSDNKINANTIWNSYAEGMYDKRELNFSYTKENVFVEFARGIVLNKIDCNNLEEKIEIEKYIRENIKEIATNEEVLGGSWYVTIVLINPDTKTGEISYEEGHIESDATFTYEYNKENKTIDIINFKEKDK